MKTYKEENLKENEQNANDFIHGVEIGDAQTSTTAVPDIHMFQLARGPYSGRGADVCCQVQIGFHWLFLAWKRLVSLSWCYTAAVLQQVELILSQ